MIEVKFFFSLVKWGFRVKLGKLEIIKVRFMYFDFMDKIYIYFNGKVIYYLNKLNFFKIYCLGRKIKVVGSEGWSLNFWR